MKVASHICTKCGMEVELPDYDETRPIYQYWPKVDRAILKHAWRQHPEDFPDEFSSFSQFFKWLRTSEGRKWDGKQALVVEAQRIVRGQIWRGVEQW